MTNLIWLLSIVSQLSCGFAAEIKDWDSEEEVLNKYVARKQQSPSDESGWDSDDDALINTVFAGRKKAAKEEKRASREQIGAALPTRRSSVGLAPVLSDNDEYVARMEALMAPYEKIKTEKLVNDDLINYVASMLNVDSRKFQLQQISLDKILEGHESSIGDKIQIILLIIKDKIRNPRNVSDSILINEYKELLEGKMVELRSSVDTIGMQIMEKFESLIKDREYQKMPDKSDYNAYREIDERSRKEVHAFYYYLDGYFTSELLSLASVMLEIVTKDNLEAYKADSILKKLQNKNIIGHEISVDTLDSWRVKRQHLFALEHAFSSVLEAHQKIEEVGIMKNDLKKRLQNPRVTFYLTSHELLGSLYRQQQGSLKSIETLNKTAIEFTSLLSRLHDDYHRFHSGLFQTTNQHRQQLLSTHNDTMSMIANLYARQASSIFKNVIEAEESTDRMQEINSKFLIAIGQFWEDFRSKHPISEDGDVDRERTDAMEQSYKKTVASFFLAILDDVEKRYQEERNPLTQTATYFGIRTSQKHEFFNLILKSYQKSQGFLFDDKGPYAKNINTRIKDLETKMSEIDNQGYTETYNAISEKASYLNPFSYSVVNSVVGNPLSSWWSGSADTKPSTNGKK